MAELNAAWQAASQDIYAQQQAQQGAQPGADAGQQGADHHHIAAGGNGLDDVAGEFHAAVGDDGHAVLGGHAGGVIDGGDLGHADAGHHAGGADGAGADAHLDGVGAGGNHGL